MAKPSKKKLNSRFTEPQRLQRVMAAAGFGSRRECEKLIEAGRVEVVSFPAEGKRRAHQCDRPARARVR